MRKYAIRLAIAILTFCIGTAITELSKWIIQTIHFSDADRPYSVLEGNTVRVRPYNATFEIPESWLHYEVEPEGQNNLHLSKQELNWLYWNDGRDAEDAQVINAVLPFEDCAAHFGDKDWGNYFWNDLQGRVYVVDLSPEELATAIDTRGLNESLSVFEDASVVSGNYGSWRRLTLNIMDAPTHFILMKDMDFYFQRAGDKTVVFVFLHAGGFDSTIHSILNSFDCTSCK